MASALFRLQCRGSMRLFAAPVRGVIFYTGCNGDFRVRRYTNALYRLPPQHTIPTHSPSGEEVDTELFLKQIKRMFEVMAMSHLVESVHEMKSAPYYECLFTNDLLFQHYELALPMPKYGREHRSAEISETLRYMRACGSVSDFHHTLQDVKGGRASGGDFVSTSQGIIMGYGNSTTNRLCMLSMTTLSTERNANKHQSFVVSTVELTQDSPPLAEIVAFSGTRTLLVSDTVHGRHAAKQITEQMQGVPWQVLRLEPDCSFLSHLCGASAVFDVICDQDFPLSMERLGESGLNPFPVEWSEPRKLGISMRSVCLIARFTRGTMSGGGYQASAHRLAKPSHYNSRDMASKSRLFQGGRRVHGDQAAPLEAQLRSGEIVTPVYQRPPRYAPPMHRAREGAVVPHK